MLDAENDLPLQRLPAEISGFISPENFDPDQLDHVRVASARSRTAELEVHKEPNGEVAIIGWVSANDRVNMQDPTRVEALPVTLYMTRADHADQLVSTPVRAVNGSCRRTVGRATVLDLVVDPFR